MLLENPALTHNLFLQRKYEVAFSLIIQSTASRSSFLLIFLRSTLIEVTQGPGVTPGDQTMVLNPNAHNRKARLFWVLVSAFAFVFASP